MSARCALAFAAMVLVGRGAMIRTGALAVLMHGVRIIAVVPERHALPRRHGGHALDGQYQGDDEDKRMQKRATHGGGF